MKNFYLTSLAGAITLLSACSSMPTKQEVVIEPQPIAAPVVLQKVDAETSAPHYRLNPRNYFSPLNPILVKEITNALTPKIINPATGEIVSTLPIEVPQSTEITAAAAASQDTLTNPTNTSVSSISPVSNDSVMTSQASTNDQIAVNRDDDIKSTLLKIDPSLKIEDQQAVAIQNQVSQSEATPVIANDSSIASQAPTGTDTVLNQDSSRIIIPIHNQLAYKNLAMPAPSDEKIDVTEIDKDLILLEGKARHYPAYFKNRMERFRAEKKIKQLTEKLDVLAVDPRASYDIILRAMKAQVLSRNMDVGGDAAFKSAVYFQRLLKLKPADPETSFWYGFTLGEGGGFKESIPHLNVAVKADYQEAYLSLADSYLQMELRKDALTMLNNYKIKYPNDTQKTDLLIADILDGKRYSIWK
ncbi:MAG: hypothetical protein EOO89_22220 [Pedobacter sp.]|nr:MAG: hypothetical protein EOO89_22220 [Pedobacter sp.]